MADDAKIKCDTLHDEKMFGSRCLTNVNVDHYHSVCMYDMCIRSSITDLTPLCRAATALAHACTQKGLGEDINLNRRQTLRNCPGENM